jgi:exodeoxyribonuclease V alpha subunit
VLENHLFDPTRFGDVFDESDRLLVDGALRLVSRSDPLPETSADLYAALLLVAKALRHNHAAIDLGDVDFAALFEELWSVRDHGEARFVGEAENWQTLRDALLGADERLVGRAAMEDAECSTGGSPFAISMLDGVPRYVSTRRLLVAESRIGDVVLNAAMATDVSSALPLLDEVVDVEALGTLDATHVAFFERALTRKVSILTGGPGSGKTTSIAALLRRIGLVAKAKGDTRYRIALCAPTAKAAVRMSESIDERLGGAGLADFVDVLEMDRRNGSVHRLLGIRPDDTRSDRTIEADLVIVDEVSMLELPLFDSLLRAAGQSHVVLVGDPEQLRSVEVGAVLSDLVDAGRNGGPLSPILTELQGTHRFNDQLASLASAINAGNEQGALDAIDASGGVVHFVPRVDDIVDDVVEHARILRRAANGGDVGASLDALRALVVLGANREGDQSVAWWQRTIEERLDKEEPWSNAKDRFGIGMPIMITKNENSALRRQTSLLANGDVGVVVATPEGPRAYFLPVESGRSRRLSELDQAEKAWAFTIHKSQGSEYDEVVVSLPVDEKNRILSRELLYTAVTRAKSKVTLVGSVDVFSAAVRRQVDRVSGLTERIAARSRV